MAVHFREGADLRQCDVLAVAQGDDLIEGEDELEGVLGHIRLAEGAAVFRNLIARR